MNAAYARVPISQAMLLQAVENWKPTVSRTKLNEYELLRKIMESEDEDETEIPIPVNNKILN